MRRQALSQTLSPLGFKSGSHAGLPTREPGDRADLSPHALPAQNYAIPVEARTGSEVTPSWMTKFRYAIWSVAIHDDWAGRKAKMNTLICRRVILVAFWMGVAWPGVAQAELLSLKVPLTGASCVPPVETNGTGTAELTYDAATQVVTWRIVYSGLSSPTTMAHFHGPAAPDKKGPVVIWLAPQGSSPENPITGQANADARAGTAIRCR